MASADRPAATDLTSDGTPPDESPPRPAGPTKPVLARAPGKRRSTRKGPPSVADRLFEHGSAFDFFQAVRLLEKLLPSRSGVGRRGPCNAEIVRFRSLVSLDFPASSIYEIERPTRAFPTPSMVVTFLGLQGPSGILPRHYTELLLQLQYKAKHGEKFALRDWLDLFNHRLISLFYRAWEKYRFYLPYERAEYDAREPDTFTRAMLSLAGLGTAGMRNRLRVSYFKPEDASTRVLGQVDDLSLIFYSGLLAQRPRTAAGLAGILRDYFQLPVEVKQFQGQWLWLEADNQSRLTSGRGGCRLGTDAVLGERVWDVQGKFRVRVGPLDYGRFNEFLPDRRPVPARKTIFLLGHLVRIYAGAEFDFDVQLLLQPQAVPECELTSDESRGALLGWNTWLKSEPAKDVADDVVIDGEDVFWTNAGEREEALAGADGHTAAGGIE